MSISSIFYVHFFLPIFWCQKISNPKHSYVIIWRQIIGKKSRRKMLMKLTPDIKKPPETVVVGGFGI